MAKNKAYLASGSSPESDECFTPRMGVLPIVKYLKARGYKKVWCPFDTRHSFYVRVLKEHGFFVLYGHKNNGFDFFEYHPDDYDCIVSNPPFSLKDEVLKRVYELGKPFALLLPQNSFQSLDRVEMFIKHGVEYLGFNRRVPFYTLGNLSVLPKGNHFACGYFCKDFLPEKLVFERLEYIQEPYDERLAEEVKNVFITLS